jgi:hypothetical protein
MFQVCCCCSLPVHECTTARLLNAVRHTAGNVLIYFNPDLFEIVSGKKGLKSVKKPLAQISNLHSVLCHIFHSKHTHTNNLKSTKESNQKKTKEQPWHHLRLPTFASWYAFVPSIIQSEQSVVQLGEPTS